MQIVWHGQSYFQIEARHNKSEHTLIVIDPFSEEIGLRVPKLQADVLLITHQHYDHNNVKTVSGTPFLIDGPGEYEIKKVFIQGIPAWHDQKQGKERGSNTIYTIEAEEMKICHLGDLGQKELTGEQLEKIGDVDILMIPVGGVYTISAKEALEIMSQLEPRITIPMHYQLPKLKIKLDTRAIAKGGKEDLSSLNGVDKFLKSLGIKSMEPLSKLSIKSKDISPEEAKIILLRP